MNEFSTMPRKNCYVKDLISGNKENGVLAGRVIGLLDVKKHGELFGFILQDDSGRIVVSVENGELMKAVDGGGGIEGEVAVDGGGCRGGEGALPGAGDIVQVEVRRAEGGVFKVVGKWSLLVRCEDFFIGGGAPNFLKTIIDENLKEKLRRRCLIIEEIRRFFLIRGFLEIDTPSLVKFGGQEPHLDLFESEFVGWNEAKEIREKLYLITSPEYSLKKYLVAGFEKIFQITRSFRNKESFSNRHNPEFSIIEWYRAYANYHDIMNDVEELFKELWLKFGNGSAFLSFGGGKINVLEKWERLSVVESFEKLARISRDVLENEKLLRNELVKKGYQVMDLKSYEDLFFKVFLNEIEPKLGFGRPTILFDYPASMAALSKKSFENEKYAERFEVYVGGLELCNAFSELNDWKEQEGRLLEEKNERSKMGKTVFDVDSRFIDALKIGMPPSGGIALGIDRLIMLLLEEEKIENILFFPYRDL